MVEFLEKDGERVFYVHESRVEEYKGLGYKPAPSSDSVGEPKKTTAKRKRKTEV